MKRRDFITLAGGMAVWPLSARAQQSAMPVIGFLQEIDVSATPHLHAAFLQALAEAGYVKGKNLAIEYRFYNRPELLPEAAGNLVRNNVNVIFAAGPLAVAATRNATNSIPIVAIDLESDPLATGYVKSFARPGGNLTGMFLDIPELSGKQVGLLKEIVPRLSRIAIFGIPGLNTPQFAATEVAARAFTVEAEIMEVRVPSDFEAALETAGTRHVEAGILLSSPPRFPLFKANRRACDCQTAPTHLLVRRISKSRRLNGLWAERRRVVPKMRGLRRENPVRCQAKRLADTAPREVRSGDQPQDRYGTRP